MQDLIKQCLDQFLNGLKHFPGHWHTSEDQGGNSVVVIASEFDDFEVCAVWNAGPECLDEDLRPKAIANSKLIARAPDMLRSICWTYLYLLFRFREPSMIRLTMNSTLEDLRNQISHATGLDDMTVQETFEQFASWIEQEQCHT